MFISIFLSGFRGVTYVYRLYSRQSKARFKTPDLNHITMDENRKDWIQCSIMIEVLGKPKEYVSQVLSEIVVALKKTETVQVLNEKQAEPKPQETLFSSFVEVEMLVKDVPTMISIIFNYMPSSIEIIKPTELKFNLNDANHLFNDMSARLHEYDNTTKKLKITNMILVNKLKELSDQLAVSDLKKADAEMAEKKDEKDSEKDSEKK